jgi:hypothetical protein
MTQKNRQFPLLRGSRHPAIADFLNRNCRWGGQACPLSPV